MSLPADVLAFNLKLEVPADHTGDKRATRYTIIPSTELIHPATKLRLLPEKIQHELAADAEPKVITLPHPAGTGILDATGAEVTDWRYEVTEHQKINGVWAPVSGTRIVQPVLGQTDVDLALIPVEETPRDEHRITPADRALAARDDAERHAGYAAGSALTASAAAGDASMSAAAAAGSASEASSARAGAETAQQGAVTARTAAESARDAAATARTGAETARDTATTKASAASASAGEAATSAAGAVAAVADARTARDQASGHASAASTSATDAAGSATAAGQSASGAAAHRAAAETAKTGADTARTGAETARTGAETARTGAETAKTAAETARDVSLAGQFAGSALGGADLNTITTPGVWRQDSNTVPSVALNYPQNGMSGILQVTNPGAGDSRLQVFTPFAGGLAPARGQYIRRLRTGVWTSWVFMSSQRVNSPAGQPGVEIFTWDDVSNREQGLMPLGFELGTADLNVVTTPGEYAVTSNANATTARNYPVAGAGGILEVRKSGIVIFQRFTIINTAISGAAGSAPARGAYVRRYSGAAWTAWFFIATQRINAPTDQPGIEIFTWDDINSREQSIVPGPRDLGAVDLNVVTLPGTYRQLTAAEVTTARNYPVNSLSGMLEVLQWASSNANAVVQRFTVTSGVSSGRGFFERRWNGGWGEWYFISSQRTDQTAGRAIYVWDNLNGREQMIYGDTGWRSLALPAEWSGTFEVRRVLHTVDVRMAVYPTDRSAGTAVVIPTPAGFRRAGSWTTRTAFNTATGANISITDRISSYSYTGVVAMGALSLEHSFITDEAWPTSLPGTAVGGISA